MYMSSIWLKGTSRWALLRRPDVRIVLLCQLQVTQNTVSKELALLVLLSRTLSLTRSLTLGSRPVSLNDPVHSLCTLLDYKRLTRQTGETAELIN